MRGLSPTGSGLQQVSQMCAGFVVILSSLKFLVQSASMRKKELPMKKAFALGIPSVLDTVWTIGTSYIAAVLPG